MIQMMLDTTTNVEMERIAPEYRKIQVASLSTYGFEESTDWREKSVHSCNPLLCSNRKVRSDMLDTIPDGTEAEFLEFDFPIHISEGASDDSRLPVVFKVDHVFSHIVDKDVVIEHA